MHKTEQEKSRPCQALSLTGADSSVRGVLPVFVAFTVLFNDMSHTSKQYYIIQ